MSLHSTGETILVVDDETLVRNLTGSMLTRYGYTVITADSVQDAVWLVEKSPNLQIDLALITNAIEFIQRIQKLLPRLPVLNVWTFSETELFRPNFASGVPYIAKPFTS